MLGHLDKKFSGGGGWVGDIAFIVTSSRLQVTLRVETCVELELSLPESDLEAHLQGAHKKIWPKRICIQLNDNWGCSIE